MKHAFICRKLESGRVVHLVFDVDEQLRSGEVCDQDDEEECGARALDASSHPIGDNIHAERRRRPHCDSGACDAPLAGSFPFPSS